MEWMDREKETGTAWAGCKDAGMDGSMDGWRSGGRRQEGGRAGSRARFPKFFLSFQSFAFYADADAGTTPVEPRTADQAFRIFTSESKAS
jgi:hypothetical protein